MVTNQTLAAVRYELPQGSTLAIKYSNLHHFVDDTKLLKFNTRVDSIIKQAYQDLKNLSQLAKGKQSFLWCC